MFVRANNDGLSGATTQVDPSSRADLALAGASTGVELPQNAISDIAKSQSLAKEIPPHIHETAKVISQIKQDMKDIETRAANAKELEAIREKLLLGHSDASSGNFQSPNIPRAIATVGSVPSIALRVIGSHTESADWPALKSQSTPKKDTSVKDPNSVGLADKQQVIGRIDDALMAVDKLLGKIDGEQISANTRLLNLTGSVAGLNAARSTVDSTPLSLSVAMNAADMIMTNIKAAIVSHGNINTDIVRLVMS